jgi:tetratricopeptide repeat family protein
LKDYESALIYLQRLKELGRNDEWLNKNLILVYSKLENIN